MIYGILFILVLLLDQISKAIVDAYNIHVELIEGLFSIANTRNSGAAFSLLANAGWQQTFFAILTSLALIGIVVYLIFTKNDSKWLTTSITFVASGAVGNFIDRIALGEVRDFIFPHFFANFNVADIAITVGGIMLVVYFLFIDDDALIKLKKKEDRSVGTNGVEK